MDTSRQNTFPKTGFVRLSNIIGNPKAKPPIAPFIPVSSSTWWNWVRNGKAPAPIKLGPKTTAWKAEDIWAFSLQFSKQESV